MRDTANKLTQRHEIRASGRIQSNVRLRLDQPFDRKLIAVAAGIDGNRIGVRRYLAIDGKHVRTIATGQGNSGLGDHVAMKRKVVCLRACVAGPKVDGYRPRRGFQNVRTRPGVCDAKDDSVCAISRIQREVLTDNQWRRHIDVIVILTRGHDQVLARLDIAIDGDALATVRDSILVGCANLDVYSRLNCRAALDDDVITGQQLDAASGAVERYASNNRNVIRTARIVGIFVRFDDNFAGCNDRAGLGNRT